MSQQVDVAAGLGPGPAGGLTTREAARRLVAYGPNELAAHRRRSPWRDLADQLIHPLALLLWLAAALSAATRSATMAVAVVAVIVLNAVFAFVQERQGERAVEALSAYLPQAAVVVRDGCPATVPARELVPGDLLRISEGDRICADARIVEGAVEVDTSTLTGETLPVLRVSGAAGGGRTGPGVPPLEATDLVFSGTACTGGRA